MTQPKIGAIKKANNPMSKEEILQNLISQQNNNANINAYNIQNLIPMVSR
jgi:hypothetical protein